MISFKICPRSKGDMHLGRGLSGPLVQRLRRGREAGLPRTALAAPAPVARSNEAPEGDREPGLPGPGGPGRRAGRQAAKAATCA